jgi:hypothetical protein
VQRFSRGGLYLNFPGLGDEDRSLAQTAFGANYHRPAALKRKYDPGNLFRLNQNIEPAG